jgi:hypothetical protein
MNKEQLEKAKTLKAQIDDIERQIKAAIGKVDSRSMYVKTDDYGPLDKLSPHARAMISIIVKADLQATLETKTAEFAAL